MTYVKNKNIRRKPSVKKFKRNHSKTSGTMEDAEVFKFIEVVQGHENLWNISCNGYKDVVERNGVWDQVGKQFGLTGEKAKAQFKCLRDKYRRQKEKENSRNRSGAGACSKVQWMFFKHLQFLDTAFKKRRVTDSVAWTADNSIDNELFRSIDQNCSSTPLPSPVIDSDSTSPTWSQSRAPKKVKKTLEEVYEDATSRLLTYLEPPKSQTVEPNSPPKYRSAVVDFLVETLGKLNKEEVDACEKEIMKVATKFRYNY